MFKRMVTTTLVGALVLVAGGMPATAKAGDVIVGGACGFGPSWRLELSPVNRGIDVAFKLDSNVPRQTWRVSLLQNGQEIFAEQRTTKASGSFTVRLLASDTPGTDTFAVTAVNTNLAGELCLGTASIG